MSGSLIVRTIQARSILSKSGIPGADYCVNAYVGCAHACRYCYATFMQRYSGHKEAWGKFVDVKINAPELLDKQVRKAVKGRVMISSVTDAYQPAEVKYRLTRQCLEILSIQQFPVSILTKSPLVLRDIDVIKRFNDVEVGVTVTTDDEKMRKVFEPGAPPIDARINTLRKLKEQGIKTYVFIGPILPMNPDILAEKIGDYADSVLISRMNYISKTAHIFREINKSEWLDRGFTADIIERIRNAFRDKKAVLC